MHPLSQIQDDAAAPFRVRTGWLRWLFVLCGWFFVGLAILGMFLPILPTTPFLLLAAFFFVRSSPRLHAWLLRSRWFGPFLRDWNAHKAVRPRVKAVALSIIPVMVTGSVVFGNLSWPLIALLATLGAVGMIVVARLPVIRHAPGPCVLEAGDVSSSRQAEPTSQKPLASE